MLKFLIILILIIYLLYKTAAFLFRLVFGSLRNDSGRFQGKEYHPRRRAPGSNLNIDKIPESSFNKKKQGFEGGEYIDFEELK